MKKINFIYSVTEIVKNKADDNIYKYVVLPNNLKFLLISDLNADKSGCSLSVGIGSFDEKINGLAHFLEHLLFMGTEKYPEENAYMDFLNLNNGSSNAYTTDECTVYYFDISNNYIDKGLDMFAQFFISPLFNKDSVDREMSAVNSEFLSNVENENSRMHRILQLCCNKDTRESNFNIGNFETLNIENIRDHVINLYETKYSADKMIGVLYSNKSIEEMEKMINVFNLIKNKNNQIQNINENSDFFYNRFIQYILKVQKINFLHKKIYSFQDIIRNDCKNKIIKYKSIEKSKKLAIFIKTGSSLICPILFTHIVDQFNMEDTGCIAILKDKNLAYDVSISIDNVSWYGLFCIEIYPTNYGTNKLDDILKVINEYFLNFKNWNFKCLINRNKINFEYKEKEDVIDVVEELSERLQTVSIVNILNFEYTNDVPDQDLINEVIKSLGNKDQWIILYADDEYTSNFNDGIFGIEVDSFLIKKMQVF